MTPTQYKAELARLGLDKEQAAALLGVVRRTSYGYWNGERRIPEAVRLLLRAIKLVRNGRRRRVLVLRRSLVLTTPKAEP